MAEDLRFDRERINRYSLDQLPRSLSVRQDDTVWIGFDLERAKVYKVWRAPEKKAGLQASGFVMRSVGDTLFEDTDDNSWVLRSDDTELPLTVRYLGVSDRDSYVELRWELRHAETRIQLTDRIVTTPAPGRIERTVKISSLPEGHVLIPPASTAESWMLVDSPGEGGSGDGASAAPIAITLPGWYRLVLR